MPKRQPDTFRVPLDNIKVKKPVPCGMDIYRLMSFKLGKAWASS